jgi:hypothetical protein
LTVTFRVTSGTMPGILAVRGSPQEGEVVSDPQRKLHATIDDITTDVARLKAVQATKRDLHPGDPRGSALASQAVEIASQLVPKTVHERELAEDLAGD